MSVGMPEVLLLLPIVWPLVIAGLLILPSLRSVGLVLLPWAALPALVLSVFVNNVLELPGIMLGGVLALDASGQVFLSLISMLWLASGVLACARLRAADSSAMGVMLLLAMSGSFSLVLAGDALLFFSAATITGYSLYGALVFESDMHTRNAGRTLIVLLVVSDLLLFEALLMLGQVAGAVDFGSLQQALMDIDDKSLVLSLLIIGFGIKSGMLGVHFWLPLVFARAGVELRPALVAFIFGASLLGSWRLMPPGQLDASIGAAILQWLAWLTLIYASIAGLSQIHRRAVLGYVMIVLASVWLVVLNTGLQQPALWESLADPSAAVLIQSGAALAAILLLDEINEVAVSRMLSRFASVLNWLAVLLLAMSPLGLAWGMEVRVPALTIMSAMVIIALLAGNSFLHGGIELSNMPAQRYTSSLATTDSRPVKVSVIALWAAVLTLVATFAAGYQLSYITTGDLAISLFSVLAAISVAVLNSRRHLLRLPSFVAGDVVSHIINWMILMKDGAGRLFVRGEEQWTTIGRALGLLIQFLLARNNVTGLLETALLRWRSAMSLLLLLVFLTTCLAVF